MPKQRRKSHSKEKLFQIKVRITEAPLPIWRRLLMHSAMPLSIVHDMLQIAFGWTDSHLHEFQAQGMRFGQMEFEEGEDPELLDETKYVLGDLFQHGSTAVYRYDFGDCWEHEMLLEKILPADRSYLLLARCTAGKRACPPEDVGGVSGYAKFLDIVEDPEHPEREENLRWIGSEFDPESFDARLVNVHYRMMEAELEEAVAAENDEGTEIMAKIIDETTAMGGYQS